MKIIYWLSLLACVTSTAFFGGHFLYAMLYREGRLNIDINSVNEGWLEVGIAIVISILGAAGLISYFIKFMNYRKTK